jgi:peptidoglycan LD-endopeptidase LytH
MICAGKPLLDVSSQTKLILSENSFEMRRLLLTQREKGRFGEIVKLPKDVVIRDFTKGIKVRPLKEGEYDVGKFNERRMNMYETEHFKKTEKKVAGFDGMRNIHVGIDIGGPVNTPILSFADGKILHFGYNPAKGDYGNVIVTEHEFLDDDENKSYKLYALYGHLGASSIKGRKTGEFVSKGDRIGCMGARDENGDWPPHVHFQLSVERPETHDMPGVVSSSDHERAMKTFLDPRLVLGDLYKGQGSGPRGMWIDGDDDE